MTRPTRLHTNMIDATASPALRSAMDANMVAFWAAYGRGEGCTLQRAGDAVWFYTGIPHPFFNGVPRARFDSGDVHSTIDALQARVDAHGTPALWWLGPDATPDDLESTLARRGLELTGEVPGMALTLQSIETRLPDIAGFSVEEIEPPSQALWARVAATGTGAHETAVSGLERVESTLGDAAYRAQRRFIGYLDGTPVATAALVLDSGVAGVYAIATIPGARRRGIGRYMTMLSLLKARQLGYKVAILQSSAAGYPLYKALGFHDVCKYRLYMQTPGSIAAHSV